MEVGGEPEITIEVGHNNEVGGELDGVDSDYNNEVDGDFQLDGDDRWLRRRLQQGRWRRRLQS